MRRRTERISSCALARSPIDASFKAAVAWTLVVGIFIASLPPLAAAVPTAGALSPSSAPPPFGGAIRGGRRRRGESVPRRAPSERFVLAAAAAEEEDDDDDGTRASDAHRPSRGLRIDNIFSGHDWPAPDENAIRGARDDESDGNGADGTTTLRLAFSFLLSVLDDAKGGSEGRSSTLLSSEVVRTLEEALDSLLQTLAEEGAFGVTSREQEEEGGESRRRRGLALRRGRLRRRDRGSDGEAPNEGPRRRRPPPQADGRRSLRTVYDGAIRPPTVDDAIPAECPQGVPGTCHLITSAASLTITSDESIPAVRDAFLDTILHAIGEGRLEDAIREVDTDGGIGYVGPAPTEEGEKDKEEEEHGDVWGHGHGPKEGEDGSAEERRPLPAGHAVGIQEGRGGTSIPLSDGAIMAMSAGFIALIMSAPIVLHVWKHCRCGPSVNAGGGGVSEDKKGFSELQGRTETSSLSSARGSVGADKRESSGPDGDDEDDDDNAGSYVPLGESSMEEQEERSVPKPRETGSAAPQTISNRDGCFNIAPTDDGRARRTYARTTHARAMSLLVSLPPTRIGDAPTNRPRRTSLPVRIDPNPRPPTAAGSGGCWPPRYVTAYKYGYGRRSSFAGRNGRVHEDIGPARARIVAIRRAKSCSTSRPHGDDDT